MSADVDIKLDPNTLLRSLRESENKYTSLKRQFLALQGVEQLQKDEIRNLKDDNEELRQHRSNLLHVSDDAASSTEQKEKAYQEERVSLPLLTTRDLVLIVIRPSLDVKSEI